ncbi:RidA family protein [Oceanibium sediminis]|uniref:RidA family protein n=1 Tax=Oceanibium sediminis TaxID=2026339 RepID=UPI0013001937|nr:RidA family protein [Oceanibium sediminis]
MTIRTIYSPKVLVSPNPHSQATMAGNHFYTATVGLDLDGKVVGVGDIQAQTRQALTNLTHLLEAAGGGLQDVARVMIYLSDMRYFQGMNEAYKEFFKGDTLPSRATVTGTFGIPELLVEFDVIAYIEQS